MRRILATLAVVTALLFSAGSAWAEETNDISDWLKSEGLEKFEKQFLNNDITVKPPFYVPLPDRVMGTGGRMFKA